MDRNIAAEFLKWMWGNTHTYVDCDKNRRYFLDAGELGSSPLTEEELYDEFLKENLKNPESNVLNHDYD